MQQDVMQEHPRAFATTRKGTPALDLPKALIADLVTAGVHLKHLPSVPLKMRCIFLIDAPTQRVDLQGLYPYEPHR
jgi:hypothetical protein